MPDQAQPEQITDRIARMRQTHKEITMMDRGECQMMADYRWACDEIERLRRVELAAGNVNRYALVIESAVRESDPLNYDGVLGAILRLQKAIRREIAA